MEKLICQSDNFPFVEKKDTKIKYCLSLVAVCPHRKSATFFIFSNYQHSKEKGGIFYAKPSEVTDFSHSNFPKEVEIIPLDGHSFVMTGFRTPDDVVFLADCLSSRETIDKYQISFIYDVAEYLNTLERIKSIKAKLFVPAHAPVSEDITELADYNINKVHEIIEKLLSICQEPVCFEHILQKLFSDYNLTMNFEQYVLVGSAVRSYLSFLKDNGKLEVAFENNMLLWRSVV